MFHTRPPHPAPDAVHLRTRTGAGFTTAAVLAAALLAPAATAALPATASTTTSTTASTTASATTPSETPVLAEGFEDWSGALPTGWSRWNAAGTGSVAQVEGPTTGSAVRVVTDTTTSRLALVRDVPLPAASRTFALTYTSRVTAPSGTGRAGVRINVLGANNESWFFGRSTATDGWQTTTEVFTVPASATGVRVHVFNDGLRATQDVDDLTITPSSGTLLRAETSPAGDVALRWTAGPGVVAATYDVHRAAGTEPFEPAAGNLLRSVPGTVTALADVEWEPGTDYTYVVVARSEDGTEAGRTNAVTRRSPATDPTATSYLSLTRTDGGLRAGFRAAADAPGPLAVVSGNRPFQVGETVSTVQSLPVGRFGGADVAGLPGLGDEVRRAALVDADGTVLATAEVAGLQHPRIGLDADTVAKIRRQVAEPGTPQDAWRAVVRRVEGGRAAAGTTPDRWAREAAFLYAVTGEQRYADLAFEGFAASAAQVPFGAKQELDTANPVSQLALVYDWAYQGWSEDQRAQAVAFFERTAAFFELVSHPNLTLPDKASNWVGVVRGAELAQHLAVRGDGGYGLREARVGQLVDQLRQHNEAANTAAGHYQEGLDYLDYDAMIATSGTLASFDAGIDALRESWYAPRTTDLLLRTVSLRQRPTRLQWGVGTASPVTAYPLYLERAAEDRLVGPLVELFERTAGHRSASPWYSPGYVTQALVDWPEQVRGYEAYSPDTVLPALLDDDAGAYTFRNRLADADDTLLQLNNRNRSHLGWQGYDAFGLSLISHDTLWAAQPGKDQANAAKYSRVLVDGATTQVVGQGTTSVSRAFPEQGGGFVSLANPAAFGVDAATRDAVVDLTDRGATDAVLAFSDRFADDVAHTWTWQLAPEAGTTLETERQGSTLQFTLRRGDAWLRGWVLDADGVTAELSGGAFRLQRSGTEAGFDLVVALGSGAEAPSAAVTGSAVTVEGAALDLADLAAYVP
ncbi:hypothetical protein [Antribacter gilvus]|uniref:hypothetical protein n=1 Tax=Antribacter gilvus TaxID=2304675 RepID=UPI000F789B22|nr:hypothetical protein [Antribacter gilvus]